MDNSAVPKPPPPALPQVGQLFTQSWHLFTTHFSRLIVIALIPLGFGFVFGLLGTLIAVLFQFVSFKSDTLIPFLPLLIPLAVIILVLVIVLFTWNQMTLIQAVKFILDDTSWTFKSAYSSAWSKIRSYWWLSFILGFSLLGGFIFFLIPGLIMAVWFSLAVFILFDENLTGLTAILKSRVYVNHFFWPVLGRQLLLWLTFFLLNLVTAPFSFIPIIGNLAQSALQLVGGIFSVIYLYLLFRQLKSVHPQPNFVPSASSKTLVVVFVLLGLIIPVLIILGSTVLIAANLAS